MGLTAEFEKTLREKFVGDLNPQDKKSIAFERLILPLLSKISGVSLYQDRCDGILSGLSVAKPEDLEKILERLNFRVRVFSNPCDLKKQYIIASNHPTGPLDGIFMQKIFNHLGLRGKTMGDDIMSGVEPMRDAYIGLSVRVNGKSRISQLRAVKKEIKSGLSLGLFPAASVSHYDFKGMRVKEYDWQPGFIEMAKSNNLDIVPVYISANLSFWHYFFKLVYPDISSLRLFRESIKFAERSAGNDINIYIGDPLSIENLESTEADAEKVQNICENLKYQKYTNIK